MDDRVVVDRVPDTEKPPRVLNGAWMALAGVAAVVLIFTATQGAQAPPVTTMAPLPSITVPPTIPRGEIVDRTLEWVQPVGLEDVTQVGGVVEFDGRHWLVGTAGEGIAAWASVDGVNWDEQGSVIADGDWWVDRVYGSDDVVVLSASGWRGDEWTAGIFYTRDGDSWDLTVPSRDLIRVRDVVDIGDEYLVIGWTGTPPSVSHLPGPYRELARDGVVWIDETMDVWLFGAMRVGEISRSDLVAPAPVQVPQRFTAWRGPLQDLSPTFARPDVSEVARLDDGSFLGRAETDSSLRVSPDGVAWEMATSTIRPIGMFVPWREGAVVQSTTKGLVYWEPDRIEPDPFLPADLAQLEPNQMVAGDELGLILGYWEEGASRPDPDRRVHLILGERELLLEGPFGSMELTEEGKRVWSEETAGASVELNEEGALVFESSTGWSAEVPTEEWVSALRDRGSGASWHGGIIHTLDGSEWSQTSWSEISGHDAMGQVLVATDEFVVAADHAQVGRAPVEIRVGFPLDAR